MCEINRHNFSKHFSEIEESITNADFIALDAEFTGLKIGSSNMYSLFDDGCRRFEKLHKGSIDTLIIQLGLTAFRFEPLETIYKVKSWNFYVFPDSFGSLKFPFTCSGASLKFLIQNNFDFNQCFYHGVPFLNERDVKCFQEEIEGTHLMLNLTSNEEDELEEIRMRLSEDITKDLLIECKYICPYIVHIEVQQRFKYLWSTLLKDEPQNILISKIDPSVKESRLQGSKGMIEIKKELLKKYVGLSEVISILRKVKKPIVGHNFILDLAKLYHQFINPLSNCYETFKKKIREEFPVIFDTKYMAVSLKRELESRNMKDASKLLRKTRLSSLYKQLEGNLYKVKIFFEPVVRLDNGFEDYEGQSMFHVAGYDSLITGKIFIYLAHISSAIAFYEWNFMTPLYFSAHLEAVFKYKNKIYVSNASFPYYDLERDEIQNLSLLYVTCKDGSISANKLSNMYCQYGHIEAKPYLPKRFLVACPRKAILKKILNEQIINNPCIAMAAYNHRLHSKTWITFRGLFAISMGSAFGYSTFYLFS
uniref:Vezatin, adherens junctions transmembrane protein [Latimeria chalumnae] n=1 Tax=Lepeophtheirus salmonis TaxID=72036 RepID=A0A0K2TTZ9_LEPSM